MVGVGFTLQPDPEFLAVAGPLLDAVDYCEIAPETTWREGPDGALDDNDYGRVFSSLAGGAGKPLVGHGVGLSLGGAGRADSARRRRWLRALARDQRRFRFRWYTDHLGVTAPDGLAYGLPLPLDMSAASARAVRRRLSALRRIVADVGFENPAHHFVLGDPLDEPAFLRRAAGERGWLLLDLHNVYTMAVNLGFDPGAYLARVDLGRVIEIHVSGGADSDPRWLASGRVFRLDGHDSAVPEPVWRLCEEVAPRCRRLRGITLERMEGTVTSADARALRAELRRLRRIAGRCR